MIHEETPLPSPAELERQEREKRRAEQNREPANAATNSQDRTDTGGR